MSDVLSGSISITRNRQLRRAAAKPAVCAKPLMLSTVASEGHGQGGREGGR